MEILKLKNFIMNLKNIVICSVFVVLLITLSGCNLDSVITTTIEENPNLYVDSLVVFNGNQIIFSDYQSGDIYCFDTSSFEISVLFQGTSAFKLFSQDSNVYFFNKSDFFVYRFSLERLNLEKVTNVFDDIWMIANNKIYGNIFDSSANNRLFEYSLESSQLTEICLLDGDFQSFHGNRLAYSNETFYKTAYTDDGIFVVSVDLSGEKTRLDNYKDTQFTHATQHYFFGQNNEGIYRINQKNKQIESIIPRGKLLGVDDERVFYVIMENGKYSLYVYKDNISELLLLDFPYTSPFLQDNKFHIIGEWVYFLSLSNLSDRTTTHKLSLSENAKVYQYLFSLKNKSLLLFELE